MSISYADDNVIRKFGMKDLKDEHIVNQDHLYTIVHSHIFDCNPHTKIKYMKDAPVSMKMVDNVLTIFVPTTTKSPIEIPNGTKNIILDIRSYEGKGKELFTIFNAFISDFAVNAMSAVGEKGKIYMNPTSVSDTNTTERPQCPLKSAKVTVLIDRYTLSELDEYCSMLLAYFYKHYTVKGKPHKMFNYIFKPIRIGEVGKKINICVPVLKLL